jgi:hypothetical protein
MINNIPIFPTTLHAIHDLYPINSTCAIRPAPCKDCVNTILSNDLLPIATNLSCIIAHRCYNCLNKGTKYHNYLSIFNIENTHSYEYCMTYINAIEQDSDINEYIAELIICAECYIRKLNPKPMNMNIEFKIPDGYIQDTIHSTSTKLVFTREELIVPDNIALINTPGCNFIAFNNNKQLLTEHYGVYDVRSYSPYYTACPLNILVPIERQNLKPGDIAFRSDIEFNQHNAKALDKYCVIVNDKEYAYITERSVHISNNSFNYWYKAICK